MLFFCDVSCSFQTTEHPESFFFAPVIVQLDRKNEILSCISKSFSIVVPVILSFLFSWLISFHSPFQAFRAVAFIFLRTCLLFHSDELSVFACKQPKSSKQHLFTNGAQKWQRSLSSRINGNFTKKMISLNFVYWKLIRRDRVHFY